MFDLVCMNPYAAGVMLLLALLGLYWLLRKPIRVVWHYGMDWVAVAFLEPMLLKLMHRTPFTKCFFSMHLGNRVGKKELDERGWYLRFTEMEEQLTEHHRLIGKLLERVMLKTIIVHFNYENFCKLQETLPFKCRNRSINSGGAWYLFGDYAGVTWDPKTGVCNFYAPPNEILRVEAALLSAADKDGVPP